MVIIALSKLISRPNSRAALVTATGMVICNRYDTVTSAWTNGQHDLKIMRQRHVAWIEYSSEDGFNMIRVKVAVLHEITKRHKIAMIYMINHGRFFWHKVKHRGKFAIVFS